MKTIFSIIALSMMVAAAPGDEATLQRARREESFACVQCHSLRIVHSQRLSKAAWTKEVDKMIGWGAPVRDRQLLIDYLVQEYSDTKPVPDPERSGDGTARAMTAEARALKDKFAALTNSWAKRIQFTDRETAAMRSGKQWEPLMTKGPTTRSQRRSSPRASHPTMFFAPYYPGKILDRTILGSYSISQVSPLRLTDASIVTFVLAYNLFTRFFSE
jgi:hypothetical protein